MVSRETFPLTFHPSCFYLPSPNSSVGNRKRARGARESELAGFGDEQPYSPLLEMRFDFKPASVRHGEGQLDVAANGESSLVLHAKAGEAYPKEKRYFLGHTMTPSQARFYLIKQSSADGGGYMLRQVHEVCQLAADKAPSETFAQRKKESTKPKRDWRRAEEQGNYIPEEPPSKKAKSVPEAQSSDFGTSSSADSEEIAKLEAELLS